MLFITWLIAFHGKWADESSELCMPSYFKQLTANKKPKLFFYFYTKFNLPSVCIDSFMFSLAKSNLNPCLTLFRLSQRVNWFIEYMAGVSQSWMQDGYHVNYIFLVILITSPPLRRVFLSRHTCLYRLRVKRKRRGANHYPPPRQPSSEYNYHFHGKD